MSDSTLTEKHRMLEKALWSAIEDYKNGSGTHQEVQHYLDLLLNTEHLLALQPRSPSPTH